MMAPARSPGISGYGAVTKHIACGQEEAWAVRLLVRTADGFGPAQQ